MVPLAMAFFLGDVRMLAALKMNPSVPERFSIPFEGTVVSEPALNAAGDRILCVLKLTQMDKTEVNCRVRLYLRSDTVSLEGIEYGQTLSCFGHVWPQEHATNPYQYDSLNALRADGLSGMAAAKLEDVTIFPAKPSLGRLRADIRRAISERIDLLFTENPDLVRAFVLGDRGGLSRETREAFNQTGVAHLICISGLHISMLAMAVSWLLTNVFSRRTSALVTLTAVLLYGFLIGFPASLVRATVMFAVFSMGSVVGRPSDPMTRLSAAMILMLIGDPFCVYDGGFVLSFAACAGILLLVEPLSHLFLVDRLDGMKPSPKWLKRQGQRILRYFPRLFVTTLAAQLATLPAVIAYFGAQPLIGIPVNLLAIPLAMTAYPLALAGLTVSAVWMLPGRGIAWISDALFTALLRLIDAFAGLPVGELRSPRFPPWLIGLYCAVILCASGLTRFSIKKRRFMPLGLILLTGVSMLNAYVTGLPFRTVFLDAGQADAAVVRAEGHAYLFDVGDLYSPAADYVTGCCLGVDAVFLSHPHYDHAAGLKELVEKMPPGVIYVPEGWFDVEATSSVQEGIDLALERKIPILELRAGDTVCLTDDLFVCVHGPDGPADSVNDMSLVLELVYRDSRVLFTGDLSAEAEPASLPDVDVLKVPHHGSGKSTSARLLSQTTPSVCVVSVGDNHYGHPNSDTLERLEAAGSAVYRTDQCGAVTVFISPGGAIRTETYLPLEASK